MPILAAHGSCLGVGVSGAERGQGIVIDYLIAGQAGVDPFARPGFFEELADQLLGPELWPLSVIGVLLAASTLSAGQKQRYVFGALAWALPVGLAFASSGGLPESMLFWVSVLLVINLVQLIRFAARARRGMMTAEEHALIAEVLTIEEPAKQRRLRDVITWRDAETGEVLMRQGQKAPPLIYVATGQIAIEHEGLPVGTCGPDDFLGEMSMVTGQGASATVKVALPARIAVFDRDALVRLMDAMPELASAFDRRLNKGLADKIQRMNKASSVASAQR